MLGISKKKDLENVWERQPPSEKAMEEITASDQGQISIKERRWRKLFRKLVEVLEKYVNDCEFQRFPFRKGFKSWDRGETGSG